MTMELSLIFLFFVLFCMIIFLYGIYIPCSFLNQGMFCLGMFYTGIFYTLIFKSGNYTGNRNSGKSYTRDILSEIYSLSGMKSFRDDLIDRMKTGWGRFVLASIYKAVATGNGKNEF
jgi:hypothetical protein